MHDDSSESEIRKYWTTTTLAAHLESSCGEASEGKKPKIEHGNGRWTESTVQKQMMNKDLANEPPTEAQQMMEGKVRAKADSI